MQDVIALRFVQQCFSSKQLLWHSPTVVGLKQLILFSILFLSIDCHDGFKTQALLF
jgi:inner membrane protein involved in colicin E2 resistance